MVHVIHPSACCRDHQRPRPDGLSSSADSGRNDEREPYRLEGKSSSRRGRPVAPNRPIGVSIPRKCIPSSHLRTPPVGDFPIKNSARSADSEGRKRPCRAHRSVTDGAHERTTGAPRNEIWPLPSQRPCRNGLDRARQVGKFVMCALGSRPAPRRSHAAAARADRPPVGSCQLSQSRRQHRLQHPRRARWKR